MCVAAGGGRGAGGVGGGAGGGRESTSSSLVEPPQGFCARAVLEAGQGQRCLGLGAQLLIDSACATNARDSPIKAELTEACRHLRLLLLSTRLLIVTPNRGGPPTNTFNFRQRECLNNAAPALFQLQFEIPGYGAGVC